METQYEKLKKILRQMFQMDQADLDFGIYRIMNQKRDEIEHFLDKELLPQVKEEFSKYKSADAGEKQKELDRLEKTVKESGLNPDDSPRVLELREELGEYGNEESLVNEVFSHLTTFFRRYYDDGDFLSLRRYKKDTYAIPYEGEEVKLHWANADQYYIKSSEYLKDYTFKIDGDKRVHFKLVDATEEKDNIKQEQGKERKFKLYENEPIKIEGNDLYIQFTYLSDKVKQVDLNKQTFDSVNSRFKEIKGFQDIFIKRPTQKNPNRTLLEKHLNDYTARFNFDFFIHKDLGGFLRRELDFYIKNEVLFIDDLDEKNEKKVMQSIGKVKVLKHIAQKIISFLAQLEEFQKKMWLKKKFVVDCGYCVTLDRVPEGLYDEIVKNDAQREEWLRLFAINEIEGDLMKPAYSEPLTRKFLEANPYLVLDTKFFSDEFKEKLLASFENIDEACDGVIINSENFQALTLLQEKYRGKVKCVYIDPPYNTGSDGFVYKDNYQHSSWVSMMNNRIFLLKSVMSEIGNVFVSLDDNEQAKFVLLMNLIFGVNKPIANFLWKKKGTSTNVEGTYVSALADNTLTYGNPRGIYPRITKTETRNYPYKDNEGKYRTTIIEKKNVGTYKRDTMQFPIIDHRPRPGKRWQIGEEIARELEKINRFIIEEGIVKLKIYDFEDKDTLSAHPNLLLEHGSSDSAAKELNNDIFGIPEFFSNPKPKELIIHLFNISTKIDNLTMDIFAGSGTAGHAVISLNREDGGKRKYILVEMGQYFDKVLKPRIQKVVYSKDWKDGKPVSREGISHMFKYMKLESYEDTLDNLIVKLDEKQQKALDMSKSAKEDYMLGYMLDIETRESDSLLNIDRFEDPFSYTLKIRDDNELKTTRIDLVETFNYLIGLYVENMDWDRGFLMIKGRLRTGEKALVIWRNTKERNNDALNEFFKGKDVNTRDFEFDRIFVNGDNNLENLKIDEDRWKVSLIEEEFKKRMFDVKDV
jgi:adenine-specific DNA-methyltransferase